MSLHFREGFRHDVWVSEVSFNIEVAIVLWPFLEASSYCCYIVAGICKLCRNESTRAWTDAEKEKDWFGWHSRCCEVSIVEEKSGQRSETDKHSRSEHDWVG